MLNEKNIIKIVAIGPLIFIPSIVISFVLLLAKVSNDNYKKNIADLEVDIRNELSMLVKSKVDNMREHIVYRKSIVKKELTLRIKQRVLDAHKIAKSIYETYKDEKSDKYIKELIVNILRPLTWNDGDSFIWILDYDGVFHLAPEYLRHKEGTSIIDFKDMSGNYVVKDEINICKTKGEGFLWNTFTKPNADIDEQYKQVSFVKAFGFYDLYLGSGEYLESSEKKVDEVLLTSISKIDKEDNNYLFIMRDDGTFLAHIEEKYIGESLRDTMPVIYAKLKDSLQKSDSAFVSYPWKNKDLNRVDTKYAYITKIPFTDWVIGSGYHENDVKRKALESSFTFKQSHELKLKYILAVSTFLIVISLIVSYFLSNHIKIIYARYKQRIGKKNLELQELNETLEEKVKIRTLELDQATKKLELLATTDSLTKVHNRYSIMKILNAEIDRANRYDSALSVAMYDLDFFKKINDTYGHDIGDDVLIAMTKVVKQNLRDVDVIGRYGGEEFLIIMPSTPLQNAKEVTNRLHKEVAKYHFDEVDCVTISMGLVELIKGESEQTMFKRLDNLLYASKNSGRNKVSY